MAFFRAEAGGFVFLTVDELKALLDKEFGPKQTRYRLYPNTAGNLAISTHRVEGPDGPGGYYIGIIDLALKRVVWFAKEAPGGPENTFLRHDGEIEDAMSEEANGPEALVFIKEPGAS